MFDPTLVRNIQKAWNSLSNDQQTPLLAQINTAHQALVQFLDTGLPPDIEDVRHELLFAYCILHPLETVELLVKAFRLAIEQADGTFQPPIDKYGIIWGFGQFEQLDFRWTTALLALLLNLADGLCGRTNRFPFGDTVPDILSYPQDDFTVAIFGDWGTGDWGSNPTNSPAQKIANFIAQNHRPNLIIHLGDVYYAGSKSEEAGNLTHIWPTGTDWNFTLNSNHEMYPGGLPYYNTTLASPLFAKQANRSFFAIETNSWILVGLDSAYFADPCQLYMEGVLWKDAASSPQAELLRQVAAKGKPVLVFTHHNPLGYTGAKDKAPLYDQLTSILPNSSGLAYWYYGHIHIAALYEGNVMDDHVLYRCLGHGSLPWGGASILQIPQVAWSETTRILNSPDHRVANGFAILTFQGNTISETVYTENDTQSYP